MPCPTACPRCARPWEGPGSVLMMVEYGYPHPERYDGVSEYWCNEERGGCGYRQGRWTGQEIRKGECESRYGERGVVTDGE